MCQEFSPLIRETNRYLDSDWSAGRSVGESAVRSVGGSAGRSVGSLLRDLQEGSAEVSAGWSAG